MPPTDDPSDKPPGYGPTAPRPRPIPLSTGRPADATYERSQPPRPMTEDARRSGSLASDPPSPYRRGVTMPPPEEPPPLLKKPGPNTLPPTGSPYAAVSMQTGAPVTPAPNAPMMELPNDARFQPKEPRTWEESGVDPLFAEGLILRYLLVAVSDSGRNVAQETALAVPLVKELLDQLKQNKLVVHRGSTAMGDFIFELTDMGRAKAVESRRATWYVGPAPVPFAAFCQAVKEQSLVHRSLTLEDLNRAFEDLSISEHLLERLGPAIHSGKAMFLHGDPGNGKTSLAERITKCFGDTIWVPQTLLIDGHVVKLFDPATHETVDPNFKPLTPQEKLDRRWVKIKRPTVVAGGELTMEMLEIQVNVVTNVHEAPLQIKAACGTLVIDDFGRQRMPAQELLNRWIFPLERRIDFLKLPDGRKISSPFDLLLVFSTNLEPRDLVDEAFLRRIPYKIHVENPSEDEFRKLVEIIARKAEVQVIPGSVSYLIERHYKKTGRPLRYCHPRDLLLQIVHACDFERRPRIAGPQDWDRAASNYFGMI